MPNGEAGQGTQPAQPTEAELKAQMQKALDSGDFKEVAKVAKELTKFQTSREAEGTRSSG